jgi:hypothetical protein
MVFMFSPNTLFLQGYYKVAVILLWVVNGCWGSLCNYLVCCSIPWDTRICEGSDTFSLFAYGTRSVDTECCIQRRIHTSLILFHCEPENHDMGIFIVTCFTFERLSLPELKSNFFNSASRLFIESISPKELFCDWIHWFFVYLTFSSCLGYIAFSSRMIYE